MNPISRTLDARGLPCPQPVILARKALAEGGFDCLEVLVDNAAARENVLKFGAYAGCQVSEAALAEGVTRVVLLPQAASAAAQAGLEPVWPGSGPAPAAAATVLVTADGIGQGDPELARLLLRGLLYTLTEAERVPLRVIFMNSGVKLAVAGSPALGNLVKLGERGVEVLCCGTCLEFYRLLPALAVGRITNMEEIADHLLAGAVVTIG